MKVTVFGRNKKEVEPLVRRMGFKIVKNNPNIVITYGGDGTVIHSEYLFPGIPKLALKDSEVCKLCSSLGNEETLKRIKDKRYYIQNFWKIEARALSKKFTAINDIIVHNGDPRHAIRYNLWVDGRQLGKEVIGDGIVAATPFGSTGYYRSITDSMFEVGIGLAFNNSTEQSDHVVLKESSKIKLKILRGPAMVYADNQKKSLRLNAGDEIIIKKSSEAAKIIKIK